MHLRVRSGRDIAYDRVGRACQAIDVHLFCIMSFGVWKTMEAVPERISVRGDDCDVGLAQNLEPLN